MGYQSGDQIIHIGDYPVTLRLTMGALSCIGDRLSASGPDALAAALRRIGPEEARVLLDCLILRESPAQDAIIKSLPQLSGDDVRTYVPAICAIFEESFHASA